MRSDDRSSQLLVFILEKYFRSDLTLHFQFVLTATGNKPGAWKTTFSVSIESENSISTYHLLLFILKGVGAMFEKINKQMKRSVMITQTHFDYEAF